MPKALRTIIKKKEDHFRSKTPWEGAHSQGSMKVAKNDVPAEHEKNFKAVATKVYDREKDNYGHPPEKADADGCSGAAPDMTKEDMDNEEEDESEQLDELSPKRLSKYVHDATPNLSTHSFAHGLSSGRSKGSADGKPNRHEKNRILGITRAVRSLKKKAEANEETELEEGKVGKLGEPNSLSRVLPDKKKEATNYQKWRKSKFNDRETTEKIINKEETELDEMCKGKYKGKKMHNYMMKRTKDKDLPGGDK